MPARFWIRYANRLFEVRTEAGGGLPPVSVREGGEGPERASAVELRADASGSLVPHGVPGAMLTGTTAWERLSPEDAARLDAIAAQVQDELASGKPGSDAMAGALALQFLVTASRALSATPARWRPPDGVWSVADAVRYVDERYEDAFSLEFFVERCATNVSDFSRRFKELAGCPLFEYLNRRRVARACALLKSSELSILEVSQAVGYRNLSFFNRYFLRITGVSPRAFRQSSR